MADNEKERDLSFLFSLETGSFRSIEVFCCKVVQTNVEGNENKMRKERERKNNK